MTWHMCRKGAESLGCGKETTLLLTPSHSLMSLNSSSYVPSFVLNIKKVQTPRRIQKTDGLANTLSSERQNT